MPNEQPFPVPPALLELIARFREHVEAYRSGRYNETQLRREFIDPLFRLLGWDVENSQGYAEAYKDVIHEDMIRIGGSAKAPDYCFRIGGVRKFFVEAKKPSIDVKNDPTPAYQLRRYAWSAKLPLSILTDFEELAVYDCRVRPAENDRASKARTMYFTYEELPSRWSELAGIFSRESILRGSFDRYADSNRRKRGTAEVDDAFLAEIEHWRESLAGNLAIRNSGLSQRELNFSVQRTIDRIVFLRICEDRGIEPYGTLQSIRRGEGVYARLLERFMRADEKYNSGLFCFSREKGRESNPDELTPSLSIDDKVIRDIIDSLYYPESPYAFSVLPADILGQVYEQFLGKVIRLTPRHRAIVEEKPEVRKAGGVYYTPSFVVDYIVNETLGVSLIGKCPREVGGFTGTWRESKKARRLSVLDPACGSGSFLLGAYDFLLNWYREQYLKSPGEHVGGNKPRLFEHRSGEYRLTTDERKRILLAHIFGVDMDPQAVEVTKLSLLLKVLEGESDETLGKNMLLFHERALPDLGSNIKCGNSLIEFDFYADYPDRGADDDARYTINPFDWKRGFGSVMSAGGFDIVIGNPPYVLLQDEFRDDDLLQYFRERFESASFKLDTYHLFTEMAIRLTCLGGRAAMITPANFISNNNLAALRRFILRNASVEKVLVIDGGVFDGISVDNAIWSVQRSAEPRSTIPVLHAQVRSSRLDVTSRMELARDAVLADAHALFTAGASPQSNLWAQCESGSIPLGSIAHVNFGKQLRDRAQYKDDVITVRSRSEVPPGYRACLTGRDIARYALEWGGLACLADRAAKKGGCWDNDKHDAKNKLITRQIGKYPSFALDRMGFQCLNTVFMVNIHDARIEPEYLLGLLNSKVLAALWLQRFYDQRKTFPKIKGTYLKHLPIRIAADDVRARLCSLVGTILELKKRRASAKTDHDITSIERQLQATDIQAERLACAIYGVKEEEVLAIVNAATEE